LISGTESRQLNECWRGSNWSGGGTAWQERGCRAEVKRRRAGKRGADKKELRASARQASGLRTRSGLRLGVPKHVVSNLTIAIWVVVIGSVFAYLWWQGHIRSFATYVQETREELKKCTWPTWDELKGSTVLITITIVLLGAFTVVVDRLLTFIFYKH